jgi:WXXGXW repeat (2 copies)
MPSRIECVSAALRRWLVRSAPRGAFNVSIEEERYTMKTSLRTLLAQTALVVAGATAVTAASAAEVVIVAPSAPPAARYEPVPPARVGYVWDHGHWNWVHGRYVWVGGHWEAERVGHRWVPGEWVGHGAQYRWVPAHWA